MKDRFVSTSNATRFLAALTAVQMRGAEEACLMVVDGVPGLGKSEVAQWWATQTASVYLRCKREWTPAWMMRELLAELRVQPQYSFERMYRQSLEALGARARQASRDGEAFGLVVDEVDHISRKGELLETLRDLSDMLEIPVVLVGMGRVRHHLARYPQIASRVGQYVEFAPATLDDTRALVKGLCEVPVANDLVEYLHRVSDGLVREVKEGIAVIERHGRRNPGEVTLAALSGQTLLNDRRTGQPIVVRV
ncbi:MAG: ATP-binding protein [Alphaproteobacteria bacterium]|nr:ATP-binding protein [Alphaproteobacteria bacterium]